MSTMDTLHINPCEARSMSTRKALRDTRRALRDALAYDVARLVEDGPVSWITDLRCIIALPASLCAEIAGWWVSAEDDPLTGWDGITIRVGGLSPASYMDLRAHGLERADSDDIRNMVAGSARGSVPGTVTAQTADMLAVATADGHVSWVRIAALSVAPWDTLGVLTDGRASTHGAPVVAMLGGHVTAVISPCVAPAHRSRSTTC